MGIAMRFPPWPKNGGVSLVIDGRGGTAKGSCYRDLLRNRLGDDVTVSAEKLRIFLYAGSAKAAGEAAQVARAASRGNF